MLRIIAWQVTGAFLILLLAFLSWKLYLAWKNRIWDGSSQITIVEAGPNPKIYSFDPTSQELAILELPYSLEIEASYNLGSWFVGSLYELGLQKRMKGELLRSSLQKSLSIPIDAWVASKSGDVFFQDKGYAKIIPLDMATNLNFIDRLNLLIKGSGPRITRKEINLITLGAVRKKDDSSQEEAYVLTSKRLEATLTRNFRDELVFSESKTISIINTTSRTGLAQEVSQVVGNLGVKVIETKQNSQPVEYCILKGSPKELASNSASRLERLFKCKKEASPLEGPANLELTLGEAFAQEF